MSNTSVWGDAFDNIEQPVQPAPVEGFIKEQKKKDEAEVKAKALAEKKKKDQNGISSSISSKPLAGRGAGA